MKSVLTPPPRYRSAGEALAGSAPTYRPTALARWYARLIPCPVFRLFLNRLLLGLFLSALPLGGLWLLWRNSRLTSDYLVHTQQSTRPLVEVVNPAQTARLVRLPDGSLVRLQPGARLSYPGNFSAPRLVYLSGTAFFELEPAAAGPFLIYANALIVRATDARLTVYAPERGGAAKVVVRTGQAVAYPIPRLPARFMEQQSDEQAVTLRAYQQATYWKGDKRPEKTSIDSLNRLMAYAPAAHLVFYRTPIAQVLRTIGQEYGVRILYDAPALAGCTLTARIQEGTLFRKLDAIAAAANLTYRLDANGTIRMRSPSPTRINRQ